MFNVPSDLSWRIARIPKKTPGKFRTLRIPNDALKAEQQRVLAFLYSKRELRPAAMACGFVKYRNTCTGLLRHNRKAEVIVTLDIKDFFDNFPVDKVRERLTTVGIPAPTVDEIMTLCTFEGRMLPQGAPTSPALTNIGMLEVDLMLYSYAASHGFTYSRYADDLAFVSTPKKDGEIQIAENRLNADLPKGERRKRLGFSRFISGVNFLLKETLGLRINSEKNQVIRRNSPHKSPRITGVVIRRDGMGFNAPRVFRNETRAGLFNLYQKLQKAAPTSADYATFGTLLGRVVYMDHVRSYSDGIASTADPRIEEDILKSLIEQLVRRNHGRRTA